MTIDNVYKNVSTKVPPSTNSENISDTTLEDINIPKSEDDITILKNFINLSNIHETNKLIYNIVENLENSLDDLIIHVKEFIHTNNNKLDTLKNQILDETLHFQNKIDLYLS